MLSGIAWAWAHSSLWWVRLLTHTLCWAGTSDIHFFELVSSSFPVINWYLRHSLSSALVWDSGCTHLGRRFVPVALAARAGARGRGAGVGRRARLVGRRAHAGRLGRGRLQNAVPQRSPLVLCVLGAAGRSEKVFYSLNWQKNMFTKNISPDWDKLHGYSLDRNMQKRWLVLTKPMAINK